MSDSIKWKRIDSKTITLMECGEPVLRHIIKTGRRDSYLVITEDGYDSASEILYMNRSEIESIYNITI